ncbi:MAG: DUF4860 domain-containing protein [Eggerthellaceae bacterium]|nr:DUF4860 domain-containing protein [Eggerthellaceae bacterium]
MTNQRNNAAALSLTRLREYEKATKKSSYAKFEILLFALIIGTLLLTLGMGVSVYRNISIQRWADEQNRTGLTLIANSVRITDSIDAVGVGAGPEGQALVLTERFDDGAYETRIYLHEGFIVEEYALAGAPYAPERATQLVESSTFTFSYANGLLTVRTDQGTQEIMLHSVRRSDPATAAATEEGAQHAS